MKRTVHFHLTKIVESLSRISVWKWGICSIVVINYYSSAYIFFTCNVNWIWNCCFCVKCVLIAKYSIVFVRCIRYIKRKSQKSWSIAINHIYKSSILVNYYMQCLTSFILENILSITETGELWIILLRKPTPFHIVCSVLYEDVMNSVYTSKVYPPFCFLFTPWYCTLTPCLWQVRFMSIHSSLCSPGLPIIRMRLPSRFI